MQRPRLTDTLARSAAQDAANRRMRKGGRTRWTRGDYNEAVRVLNSLKEQEAK